MKQKKVKFQCLDGFLCIFVLKIDVAYDKVCVCPGFFSPLGLA